MYLKEFATIETSLASPRIRPSRHKYARVEVILKATLAIHSMIGNGYRDTVILT
jgi:hypothetical protein